jgi:hypothetical protein
MKKQLTAVEWLQEQFKAGFNYNIEEGYEKRRDEIFAQAKEMEKEQMLNAFQESRLTHPMIGFKHETFVEYYKQFKQQEQ